MAAPLTLRAASGPGIGMGHVVRTSAVAFALTEMGHDAVLVVDDEESAGYVSGRGLDVRVTDKDELWCKKASGAVWLDGFRDWTPVLHRLGEHGVARFLVENRTAREWAEYLVYPALHHVDDDWDRAHPERLCAGAGWIPLAPTILRTPRAEERDVDLLITFGGSDPLRSTERSLSLLAGSASRIVVSVGCHMEGRRAEIERLAAAVGPNALVLGPGEVLAPWMARSRVALTALGTTLYELAYLGTPAAILANYESDGPALDYYATNGPHRVLGVAGEVDEAALQAALRAVSSGVICGFRVPELGEGSRRLARKLIGAA